jgi:ATP-dependent Clp protease protease subunit
MFMPDIIEKTGHSSRGFSLPTKLLQDRVIYFAADVNEFSANVVIMQLLWLNAYSPEEDITMYINSPGGGITDGMGVFDVMTTIESKVNTVVVGEAASMGAFLASQGTGTRSAFKHSRMMIHQPLGGVQGQVTDIEISYKEIKRMKDELAELMANRSGKIDKESLLNLMERDYFMSAQEAIDIGLLDRIIEKL